MSRHLFVSAKSDGGDTTVVRPSNWNAEHDGIMSSNTQPTVDETIPANYSAIIIGLPLVVASGFMVSIGSGAILALQP